MTPPRFRSLSLVRNREGASVSARSELKRGWRVLAGSFLGIGAGVTSLYFYSLGVFIKPLAASFGWGRGEASLGALDPGVAEGKRGRAHARAVAPRQLFLFAHGSVNSFHTPLEGGSKLASCDSTKQFRGGDTR